MNFNIDPKLIITFQNANYPKEGPTTGKNMKFFVLLHPRDSISRLSALL